MTKCCITLIALLTFSNLLYGQQQKLSIPANNSWYKWNTDKVVKLGLVNLVSTKESFYWRLSYNGQVSSYALDIYSDKDSVYKGFITLYTEEQVDVTKEGPTHRIYSQRFNLTSKQASTICQLMNDMHISQIPSEEDINGWGDIGKLDGITYTVEHADSSHYTFKSYWTPSSISVPEAKIVQRFTGSVETIVNLKNLTADFYKHIPFESYNTGGPATAIRVLTPQERRRLKRERDEYRKTHPVTK